MTSRISSHEMYRLHGKWEQSVTVLFMQFLQLQIQPSAMQVIPKGIEKERSGKQRPRDISQRMKEESMNYHPDTVEHNGTGNRASQHPSNVSQHNGLHTRDRFELRPSGQWERRDKTGQWHY